MPNELAADVSNRLMVLADRLECAHLSRQGARVPGAVRAQADGFMAATSQHLAGVAAVLAPAVARLDGGQELVRELVDNVKCLERSLVRAKAKLYGQAQNVRRPWDDVWGDVQEQLAKVTATEASIAALLDEQLGGDGSEQLRVRFGRTIVHAQTRPHPYLPHLGLLGRVSRRVCAATDRLWDELEGRVTDALPQAS